MQACFASGQKKFDFHYLGNMGVAIVHNGSAIIIDGLHDFYKEAYLPTDTSAINSMLQKRKPFKNIIAIGVTHRLDNHFDSTLHTRIAIAHHGAVLIGSSQAKSLLGHDMQKRFGPIADSTTIKIKPNLSIHTRRIPHTNPQRHSTIENNRIEIVWNGYRIIHLGDADMKEAAIMGISTRPDVLIVPCWFLSTDGISLIEKIKPVTIIVTHISPGDNSAQKNEILQSRQYFFKKHGDKISL